MATHQKLAMALLMQKRGEEARTHLLQARDQLQASRLTQQAHEVNQLLKSLTCS